MSNVNDWCFACGTSNPIGLKLRFHEEQGKYVAEFLPKPEHQSYKGMVHGGIISTLLDEIMAGYVNVRTGLPAFTARLEVRYRHHVPVGTKLRIEGWIVRQYSCLFELKARILLPDGTVAAEGKSKVMTSEEM